MKYRALAGMAGALSLIASSGFHPVQPRYVISGRVEDPHQLRPANMLLMVGYERDGAGMAYPVTIAENGTYATNTLLPNKYVLTVFRDSHSSGRRSTPIGLTIAEVVNADLTNVNVTIRPDVNVAGRIRRQQGAPLPSSLVVKACLGEEGLRFADCQVADIAADGRFLLRNPFGPRVLQVSGTSSPRLRFDAPRVLLNGRDVTNVPTDFSVDAAADLQIVLRADAIPPSANVARARKWAPWVGAAAGATIMGLGVRDEEDLVLTGKLMWAGIGAAAGAGVGWVIGKLAALQR